MSELLEEARAALWTVWNRRWLALGGCLIWLAITFLPLYWVLITSFKTPIAVVGGPTYLPFVDFEPSLTAWSELLSGQRGQFFNTFWASTIIGLSASVAATFIGAMAAYALVRFTFRFRLLSALIFVVVACSRAAGTAASSNQMT